MNDSARTQIELSDRFIAVRDLVARRSSATPTGLVAVENWHPNKSSTFHFHRDGHVRHRADSTSLLKIAIGQPRGSVARVAVRAGLLLSPHPLPAPFGISGELRR